MPNQRNKYTSDWLNTRPVFYNIKTKRVSHNINQVIEHGNANFHLEGLKNYLDFGFSVFGQTPVENVKYLLPCQSIYLYKGDLIVESNDDPVDYYYQKKATTELVIDQIKESMQSWQQTSTSPILLPLSGGYDSRLLLKLLDTNSSTIFACTYGVSPKQSRSLEVINAKIQAASSQVFWSQIELGEFHSLINDWYNRFGVSVHSHGMYQMEFYQKIKERLGGNIRVLSGIVGDVWAGSVPHKFVSKADELHSISYTHGIHSDHSFLKPKYQTKSTTDRDIYWESVRKNINDPYYQTIHIVRSKMMLLSYLLRVPESLGYDVWSPFIEPKVALTMLNLPQSERAQRSWQKKYMSHNEKSIVNTLEKLFSDRRNTLDIQGCQQVNLKLLRKGILSRYFQESYIDWINENIYLLNTNAEKNSLIWSNYWLGGLARKLFGLKRESLEAYNAYRTLKPLEVLISNSF